MTAKTAEQAANELLGLTMKPSTAVRQARKKEALIRSGGKRIPVNLPAQAVADLERIKARDGIKTNSEAVIAALHDYAGIHQDEPAPYRPTQPSPRR